jgi:hypothetical protein
VRRLMLAVSRLTIPSACLSFWPLDRSEHFVVNHKSTT